MAKTDFPESGEDQKVSLANSQYLQFDYEYAKRLKEENPEIWGRGGNIRGNEAFEYWGKARDGDDSPNVLAWIKEREAWAARHYEDFRLPGVVAQIKWGVVGSLGKAGMKEVIADEKSRQKERERASKGVHTLDFTTKAVKPAEDGTFLFVASTPRVDRSGERVSPNWDLEAYKKNPVVLYAHDQKRPPIGRCKEIYLNGDQLMARIEFLKSDMWPFAGLIRSMYEKGFMRAVSVGFKPVERDGDVVLKSELLEISAVAIPANADALIQESGEGKPVMLPVYRRSFPEDEFVTKGLDETSVRKWFETTTVATEMKMSDANVAEKEMMPSMGGPPIPPQYTEDSMAPMTMQPMAPMNSGSPMERGGMMGEEACKCGMGRKGQCGRCGPNQMRPVPYIRADAASDFSALPEVYNLAMQARDALRDPKDMEAANAAATDILERLIPMVAVLIDEINEMAGQRRAQPQQVKPEMGKPPVEGGMPVEAMPPMGGVTEVRNAPVPSKAEVDVEVRKAAILRRVQENPANRVGVEGRDPQAEALKSFQSDMAKFMTDMRTAIETVAKRVDSLDTATKSASEAAPKGVEDDGLSELAAMLSDPSVTERFASRLAENN